MVYETFPKTNIPNEANTLAEPGVLLQDTLRLIRLYATPRGMCRELWLSLNSCLGGKINPFNPIYSILPLDKCISVSNFLLSWFSFYVVWPMNSFSLLNSFELMFQTCILWLTKNICVACLVSINSNLRPPFVNVHYILLTLWHNSIIIILKSLLFNTQSNYMLKGLLEQKVVKKFPPKETTSYWLTTIQRVWHLHTLKSLITRSRPLSPFLKSWCEDDAEPDVF